jgi:hypothetical protein
VQVDCAADPTVHADYAHPHSVDTRLATDLDQNASLAARSRKMIGGA